MRILILGGTVFVGRHLVADALKKNHDVTLFHRGKHNPGLFGDAAKTITGDRTNADDLAKLASSGEWDAVIDTCGYVPRIVRMSAEALKDKVSTYCFISTVSVYADWSTRAVDEDSALATVSDPTTEEVTGETYGGLKVLCENAVKDIYGDARTLIIRPGFIVGPHDPTDRFTYWVHRIAQGGDVLAPGDAYTSAQFIDARDLAEWNIRLLESGVHGVFSGDGFPVQLDELLPVAREVAGLAESDVRFVYAPPSFFESQGIESWQILPIFTPKTDEDRGTVNVSRAVESGLTFRPLIETVADTLAWDKTRTDETAYSKSLSREREAELLAALQNAESG